MNAASNGATRVAIVGVSGFSGAELASLIGREPRLSLTAAYSDRMVGTRAFGVTVQSQADASRAAEVADIVALATPAEVSAELAPKLLAGGARVIDLSGAFRLTDTAIFREYYRFDHPHPELLAEAHYGLPQVKNAAGSAPPIERARLVANPGCYATAAILSLAPVLAAGKALAGPVFVDGKSGVTGAGRKVAERYLFTEVAENLSLYRVIDHQHVPEIELALERASGKRTPVVFAPHLLPIRRGLITTCWIPGTRLASQAELDETVSTFFSDRGTLEGRPVIEIAKVDDVNVHAVASTCKALLGAKLDPRTSSVVSACAIDNLMKGAASQALENILGMIGARQAA